MLYDRATTETDMPKYLLLFGDCAWDNRMNTSDWKTASVDDYLLCYESENSLNDVYCYVDDGWFCSLDDGVLVHLRLEDTEFIHLCLSCHHFIPPDH